jgi:DNA-binding transcriptional LysR family regulator
VHDLNEILTFASVAELGSFTRAATRLGIPKSTASRRVAALETRLGARLIQRSTRRLSLTSEGAEYFARISRVVADIDEAEQAVRGRDSEPRGRVRVTAPEDFGQWFVAPLAAEFAAIHPGVDVEIIMTDRDVDLVAEGFDISVSGGKLKDSSLVVRQLGLSRLIFVASPKYLKRRGTPSRPEDLRGHECLHFSASRRPGMWEFKGPKGPIWLRVSGRFASNSFTALRDAALAGLGVAWMPDYIVANELKRGRLVEILGGLAPGPVEMYALFPSNRNLAARVRRLIDFLVERMSTQPWRA